MINYKNYIKECEKIGIPEDAMKTDIYAISVFL